MKPVRPEEFRFRKNKGLVLMRDLVDFSRYVGKKMGFQVTVDGMEIKETPQGIHIRGGMGGSESTCPFHGTVVTGESSSVFQFLTPGAFGSAGLPTNMFDGTSLSSFTVTSSCYIKLKVETNGISLISSEIVVDTSPAEPIPIELGTAPTEFEIDLWAIKDFKPLRIAPCGFSPVQPVESIRIGKDNPSCGEIPYDIYWTWGVR
jgi:hypothetical protein